MMIKLEDIYSNSGVDKSICRLADEVESLLKPRFKEIELMRDYHQVRLNLAFQQCGVTETGLVGTTGYGYSDLGRDQVESIFSNIFNTESALVRHQFSSGTHVLACCLKGILRPGDHLLIASGELYDTLKPTLGSATVDSGSLTNFGVLHDIVELKADGSLDIAAVLSAIQPETKMVYIQKSRGYSLRPCLKNRDIEHLCSSIHDSYPQMVIMVDNCYGEFVEEVEPTSVGADLAAGSLIKNIGGGIAPTGGYVVGRSDLVELVAQQWTAPGVGSHIGCSGEYNRLLLQGLYLAPGIVAEALKTAVFTAGILEAAGFAVSPTANAERGDIVQVIELGSAEALIAYAGAIQASAPINSMYRPEPAPMPGYDCDIIMASGSFIQGSSIELSCDGPLRPPFAAFQQGGLSYSVGRLAVCRALQAIYKQA